MSFDEKVIAIGKLKIDITFIISLKTKQNQADQYFFLNNFIWNLI
jgi:hypothetical protein